ncbi:hypothetical protein N24_0080 [Corynebacterium suranareeae]|uniref:Uncharacterized protein n=1 Tax=Corynebacterium suranareeae TaxID=2506452 RepID=A0A169RM13_9CORY|nr:transporter [Corynebacterium suranareeae]BAU94342.1 hypothetical protein N24_0080 [Corynebacterium suranareeae]
MNNRAYGLGFFSFLAGLICAAAWVLFIMVFDGQYEFTHPQVFGACVNFALVCVALSYWGYRKRLPWKRIINRIAVGLTIAIGIVFAAVSAPYDDTGLWGVGLVYICVGSFAGAWLVSAVTLAIINLPRMFRSTTNLNPPSENGES